MPHVSKRRSKEEASELRQIQSLYDRGEFRNALFRSQKVLKSLPDHVGLNALSGFAAEKIGDVELADQLLSRAADLARASGGFALDLPQGLKKAGRWQLAIPLFVLALEKNQNQADALNGLGRCLLELGDLGNALVVLADALKFSPDNAAYAADLGEAFDKSGQQSQALNCYQIARRLDPDEIAYLHNVVRLSYAVGEFDQSLEVLGEGLTRWPQDPAILNNHASVLIALGRTEEAIEQWRLAMDVDPSYSIAYSNLACRSLSSRIKDLEERIDRQLSRKPRAEDERRFRIAKVDLYEDRGAFDQAYSNLLAANALRLKDSAWRIENEECRVAQLKAQFSSQPELSVSSDEHEITPIFIIGMPRSGTSLVEAIVGRHSEVTPLGELDHIACLVNQLGLLGDTFSADQAAQFKRCYLSRISGRGQTRFVTDKMPQNFFALGHIITSMPEAKVIHVRRDPKACCWSNFRHSFSSDGLEYSYDIEGLIRFFELYQDLMDFWRARYPGRIIELDYEGLVSSPETEIRALIEVLGLEWQEACLSPQESSEVIRTASQAQVRKKIYKGSSQGWRKYEAQAGEWLSRLPEHRPLSG
ncbi:sulfotransferase [Shimia sp. R10_1]|uniref:tetratricopeptide repeat-containing sulfotransferase family protein n=1 Tax=Shimia sp. R10_1 TaxID=2821095 RepID=UPI001ADD580A|nr:tetratricopeptide repeat-containing sulfotransferase family protein [Shimia sp. R10_1]MBO9474116.1 sulfotransferase [Shimia sp. R10_1]